jgi:predicted amidohydrolase YtcJ
MTTLHIFSRRVSIGSVVSAAPVVFMAAGACSTGESPDSVTGAGTPADLILSGGKVVTVDESLPEAQAIAVAGDRILFVGSDDDVDAYRTSGTRVIDLRGRLAIPGFIEGHGHLMGLGRFRIQLDLTGTSSYQALIDMVEEAASEAEPGAWIVGRGWHQSKWDPAPAPSVRGFPVHGPLSEVSPDNPVMLRHASGHASLVNARAMELAGVTAATQDPAGGELLRDAAGHPTGILTETASRPVGEAYAASREAMTREARYEEDRQALRLAVDEALSKGITSFQDAGADSATIDLYGDALAEGELRLRLWVMVRDTAVNPADYLPRVRAVGLGDNHLTIRAMKLYADGALGSRGAWLLEPYLDDPGNAGLNTLPLDEIRAAADLALRHGFQLCTHAIGDRANREVLDIYEVAFARHPEEAKDARFRIEHAQILHPDDAARFASLGVVAAMQGIHAISDGPWTPDRIGEQRTHERAYQFRRLIDSGAVVMNGTDTPVEDVNPIASFYGVTTGRMPGGDVFNPHQLMTREEALRSYTLGAAYGAHEDDIKGSLTPGKLADIVVLSTDILTVPEDQILDTSVHLTIVGGKVVYRTDDR